MIICDTNKFPVTSLGTGIKRHFVTENFPNMVSESKKINKKLSFTVLKIKIETFTRLVNIATFLSINQE